MGRLLQDAWRAVLPSSFDMRSQLIQYSLLPELKTVVLCFVACAWEFRRELVDPAACSARVTWRTWLLIAPQTMLLVAYFLQLLLMLRFKRRLKQCIEATTLLLIPLAFCAALHTVFRTSVSLCCCSELLCPMTAPDQNAPSTKACALFFSNCHGALLRKITHLAATMGMLSPLVRRITLCLSVHSVNAQDRAACTHMARFFQLTSRRK